MKIIAAGDEVPITKYATQVVDNLAREPGYPADFAAAYAANVVSREDNVKAVVAKIELGEGDAAIVYVTDAKASTKVATVDIPAGANVPATYAGVVVEGVGERRRRPRVPRLARRRRRPGDPGRLRVPAAVMTRRPPHPRTAAAARGTRTLARSRRSSRCSSRCRSSGSWRGRSLGGVARHALASPVVLDALR